MGNTVTNLPTGRRPGPGRGLPALPDHMGATLSRHAIEFDNCRVHDFLGNYTPEGLAKLQPEP